MARESGAVAIDHMGFSVASLDEAVAFWTDAMGFELVRTGEMGGSFLRDVTGVDDPHCRMAVVVSPEGYAIELLEYSKSDTLDRAPESAGAIGAAHIAVSVADIETALERIEAHGWHAKGSPQPVPAGPRAGTVVVYVSGPDNIHIELMQPPR
ncbi:Glyoxalase [Sphingomonas sp. EC-HK361]|uniref:VOC family protein n=1 Tax=Sphingomonas sp. EC-HK361 TaxID=2038397 RepID=UPI00125A3B7A|nr:VOC family protein [Sphingomonas sp. EC-HK361]VVT15244.1 Glyoxalase [Sphingomonas sp. EC-HK361]